jgi:membrane associated rhomboid family serine protease
MGVLLGVWVVLALGINFGGVSESLFLALVGNREAILHGQVWRLVTAGLVHLPSGPGAVSHILFALLGLYFLAPTLEARWGTRRMVLFLLASSVFGFATQLVVESVLPAGLSMRLGQPYWYGSFAALEAVAVAWALGNRGAQVRLFFFLPVSSTGLLLFVVGFSVLRVIGADHPPEGLFAPFGGMIAGWLFGAGTPTPARRFLLRARYWVLQRRAARVRAAQPKLRVISGGHDGPPEPQDPLKRRRPPTDKRFLN